MSNFQVKFSSTISEHLNTSVDLFVVYNSLPALSEWPYFGEMCIFLTFFLNPCISFGQVFAH